MEPPATRPVDAYRARLCAAVAYVDAHLDEELSLDRLSRIARSSKFHFHRQFSNVFGVTLHAYVHLCRMKRAYYALAFRNARVIDVALASGYDGPEAFTRAFKKTFSRSPSDIRREPRWEALVETFAPLTTMRRQMTPEHSLTDVRVVDFPRTAVATLDHRGSPKRLGETIQAFVAWRKEHRLPPRSNATFNLVYGDPSEVPEDDFRFGLCVATDREVKESPQGLVASEIPAGRCAVLRHRGSDDHLGSTIRFLYAEWLPQSGHETRDFPLFFQRVSFFPDVPEHEAITDVFVPIR